MASAAYNQWVAQVKAGGGRVTVSPSDVPSSAYDYLVWGPKVNAKTWPIPNEFSDDGKTGYYHAPQSLQDEIKNFGVATAKETAGGAKALMDQWGIPTMFQGLGNYASTLVMIAAVMLGVIIVVNRSKRR